jgi:hypothetical protein
MEWLFIAAGAAAVWYFWPQIKGMFSGKDAE